jgi:protein-S-isoprenylcysteine O-methyltransferase Ste14
MGHLPSFSQVACAVFLLALGTARYYYFVSADAQPVDQSSPAVNWSRHVPAYFTSTAWIAYVAWLIVAPANVVLWDRWPVDHAVSDALGWSAIPFLAVAFWLFWYSHSTIGHYWSIQVRLKAEHQLVTRGPYRYVRHPLYTALFLGYLGTLLAQQSWMLLAWFLSAVRDGGGKRHGRRFWRNLPDLPPADRNVSSQMGRAPRRCFTRGGALARAQFLITWACRAFAMAGRIQARRPASRVARPRIAHQCSSTSATTMVATPAATSTICHTVLRASVTRCR